MTWILWIVAAVVAVGITIARKWPLWMAILVTPALVFGAQIVWWAVKTMVAIVITVAIIATLAYGGYWVFVRPTASAIISSMPCFKIMY